MNNYLITLAILAFVACFVLWPAPTGLAVILVTVIAAMAAVTYYCPIAFFLFFS